MVQHEKAMLRQEMLAKRNAISEAGRAEKNNAIAERLFSEPKFRDARCVALYMAIGNEVDTKPAIARCVAEGKEVLLPVVASDHHLILRKFESFEKMNKGRFGILEPTVEPEIHNPKLRTHDTKPPLDPEVIVLPGLAFGLCMHRLGYGKGYYDRLLAHLAAFRIGICFDIQVVEKLPRHSDDQRMDLVITDKRRITLQ